MPTEMGLCRYCQVGEIVVTTIHEGRWKYKELHICKECGKVEVLSVNDE